MSKETTIFVVMEMVDLGGHPVEAYFDKDMAEKSVDVLNVQAREWKKKALMRDCSYTEEQANKWIFNYWRYDLYETTLVCQ